MIIRLIEPGYVEVIGRFMMFAVWPQRTRVDA